MLEQHLAPGDAQNPARSRGGRGTVVPSVMGERTRHRCTPDTHRCAAVRDTGGVAPTSGARGCLYDPLVGQTPAQKAAKAARGQPKKRPGKTQREAIKRAQAAKKTTAGKQAPATKTAPPPRGSVRAADPSTCPACLKDYGKGDIITKVTDGWGHPGCAPRRPSAAELTFAKNKARIDSGDSFRGHKPSDWRLGASPSSSRSAR